MVENTRDLLGEVERFCSQALSRGSSEAGQAPQEAPAGAKARLDRARAIMGERPATAFALRSEVMRELDQLDAARVRQEQPPGAR